MQVRPHRDVFTHGLRGKWLHDLERARQAHAGVQVRRLAGDVLTVEYDLACVGNQESRHEREQGGLARAVGANQAIDLAALDGDAYIA